MSSSTHHHRKASSRAALPRRSTKGPLDAVDDPLSLSATPSPSVLSVAPSPLPQSPQNELTDPSVAETSEPDSLSHVPSLPQGNPGPSQQTEDPAAEERDLSFLLDPSLYHPLSQVEVPGPFRKPYLPSPTKTASLAKSLAQLDRLLSECEFLRAAQFAGAILISGTVRPTDAPTIFKLLEIRYSCLELCGNLAYAAQEAKALEDISSAFYYDDPATSAGGPSLESSLESKPIPRHVMPFSLRLQALRLQSIGFSDPRRGVSTLYDTAAECREHLLSPLTSTEERTLWAQRLSQVSIHVVNALIEMGDLDCAARTLGTLKPSQADHIATWEARMILLRIKMGHVTKAQSLLNASQVQEPAKSMLTALLAISLGRIDEAARLLSQVDPTVDPAVSALVRQNLAVAYLYNGEIKKAKLTLEELVDQGHSFQTLTINLATIYDLTSDRARDLKMALVSNVASHQNGAAQPRAFVNADFKM
ncbi:hypothetical protein PV10_03951 [Exophiala mesophila]|uniref:Uncharacterized protein n=1 Tax=Exophiala mesophila TaxID=212818 RepID=A0A0D2A0S7_EXOME|nr:uncharacterized protein PV10_03951 [Exophiala mesophila]KIV92678.1 hypothetical protein PV10_03951 [Exophiala mesophila]